MNASYDIRTEMILDSGFCIAFVGKIIDLNSVLFIINDKGARTGGNILFASPVAAV